MDQTDVSLCNEKVLVLLCTWDGAVGSGTDDLLDQDSVNGVLLLTRPVALRRLHVDEWLLMDGHDLHTANGKTGSEAGGGGGTPADDDITASSQRGRHQR